MSVFMRAQYSSIGEPATQLTMRNFHGGGAVTSPDVTRGLPRVIELFEARSPSAASRRAGAVPPRELFDRTRNSFVQDPGQPPGCRHADTLYPHPYLGHVHHGNAPCGYRHVNNVGLFGEDFPSVKRTDRYTVLLTGGTGQDKKVPDARINNNGHDASHLPPGPYQLTSKSYPYDAYAASPVHRFYQMWQ